MKNKPKKLKEPKEIRKERVRLSKTVSTRIIPNKKKNVKIKFDEE